MSERPTTRSIQIRPRYYRLYTDGAVELAEANYRHDELDWALPLSAAALVAVDCWNGHFSQGTRSQPLPSWFSTSSLAFKLSQFCCSLSIMGMGVSPSQLL